MNVNTDLQPKFSSYVVQFQKGNLSGIQLNFLKKPKKIYIQYCLENVGPETKVREKRMKCSIKKR